VGRSRLLRAILEAIDLRVATAAGTVVEAAVAEVAAVAADVPVDHEEGLKNVNA